MKGREITNYCLQAITNKGIDKGECVYTASDKYEFNINHGEISLLRTTMDSSLNIKVINDKKVGSISINKTNKEAIDEAIANAIDLSNSSQPDEANDIAPNQQSEEFNAGNSEPELEKMLELSKGLSEAVAKEFPKIKFEESIFEFTVSKQYFSNTNGVDFVTNKGQYGLSVMFTAKDGKKTSSFNYTGMSLKEIGKELIELGTIRTLMAQSVQELDAKPLPEKFVGDIIITPDCLGAFLYYYNAIFLGDGSLISGTSRLKDSLNEKVASEKLTFSSNPTSDEISNGHFVTRDGFKAEDFSIIEKGVLKSFVLGLYGANKTGKERAKNSGEIFVVEPGDKAFEEMVKNTKKGILVGRFSGGYPNSNGDFSGVAKNSFYIENGEIKHAITETMISGNLYDLFNDIVDISSERVNFGDSILPWIQSKGVTISGKI
ncbi:TldD/PmbA family protein [Oceanirhabdus seepicola]|uniref:TldD/PmbA family protein n=1 Tax=Oceanirhabdus seepicola TaxID=2828781 RepID=A0A9J6NWW5_9CLOT|nr:metallopeptidase TldD-related protein [Oceanirhabdus seepicola]MCM1988755.1 TldD/PmbA family protein [Oceanirhabdus seepicola]